MFIGFVDLFWNSQYSLVRKNVAVIDLKLKENSTFPCGFSDSHLELFPEIIYIFQLKIWLSSI